MKKHILFLSSDTGGGHRAAARAIAEAIHQLFPHTCHTHIEDFWRYHTPWPLNRIPATYPWFTGPGVPLWKLMWFGSMRFGLHQLVPATSPLLYRHAARYLGQTRPDVVVSVHPFMNHLGLDWLRRQNSTAPFITVVTDLVSVHPLWFAPGVTRCLVPTEAARTVALQAGLPPDKVAVCGLPVSLKFAATPQNKQQARRQLKLLPHKKTVLLLGGGEGHGRLFEIARELAQTAPHLQLLIIAGRNRALKNRLEAVRWEANTQIHGFVDNMPQFMAAADLLITKAGPGTLSEAFAMGLPLIISGFIPGQEAGNVAHVLQNGAGAYAESPAEIARLAADWLAADNAALKKMAANAARLARPQAALEIARHIFELIPPREPVYTAPPRLPQPAAGLTSPQWLP
ncbi:MAG: glycosyltransferase [Anaerolineae bacterium]